MNFVYDFTEGLLHLPQQLFDFPRNIGKRNVTAQPDHHPQPLSLKGRGEQEEMGIFCPKGAKNPQTSCFSPPSLQGLRQGMVPR